MRLLLTLAIVCSAGACSHASRIQYGKDPRVGDLAPGTTVFVNVIDNSGRAASDPAIEAAAKEYLIPWLTKNDFVPTSRPRGSDLVLVIQEGEDVYVTPSVSSSTAFGYVRGGQAIVSGTTTTSVPSLQSGHRVQMLLYRQAPHQYPQEISYATLDFPNERYYDYADLFGEIKNALLHTSLGRAHTYRSKAPFSETPRDQSLGCWPRIPFSFVEFAGTYVVSHIVEGAGQGDALLRVGDVIVAIDSGPPAQAFQSRRRLGEILAVQVQRGAQTHVLQVQVQELCSGGASS
jgi:hypothetical protein